ncbi:MAG: hypothetical protein JWR80_10054 [Bradyrhizobium sp.]|nr:hypothetical protein [Bradyrhizobium sp.]
MSFTYDKPLVIAMGPQPLAISSVKHGVTQVGLSDGRIVRLTIHVEGVSANADKLDVSYSVITEVMAEPDVLISDIHEGLQ